MNAEGSLRSDLLDAAVEMMGRAGRSGTVRVRGNSMRPTLEAGAVLWVEFQGDRSRRGDLLLFRQADYLVVHRLLGRARYPDGTPCLRTRGDGVVSLDPPLDPARVVGRVVGAFRGGRWWGLGARRARLYALGVALHDLLWAAAAVAAERLLGRGARSRVGAVDRMLLRHVDRCLFERMHAPIEPPPGLLEGAGGGDAPTR